MSSLLQCHKVNYECSCGKYKTLPELYFCRQCFKIKCDDCGCKEIDMLFCPRCLEVSSVPEARLKKHRCFNCNDCPICGNVLSGRTENEKCFLICQYCHWSTREPNVEDRENTKKWPVYENEMNDQLNEVMAHMKKLEIIENAPKDLKSRKQGKTWSALHLKDKYGVQQMVEKRRKMLAPEFKPLETHGPSDPLSLEEELELRKNIPLRTLDEVIMQPLAGPDQPLLPVRVSLQGRTLIRCDGCERTLVKRDFGVATYKFKISAFAREFVPDIRISRPITLETGKPSHVLLTVTNLSMSPLKMTITPHADGVVKCTTEPIEITLPSPKETSSAESAGVPAEKSEVIVFRQHNRAGLRFDVITDADLTNLVTLGLNITYTQNGSFGFMAVSEKVQTPEESGADRELFANLRVSLN